MELYVLDSLLRRTTVVDRFESLIWTERFNTAGEIELILQSTLANRKLFATGTWLALNESYRVMKVETVEDSTDDDGKELLKVTGRSIEAPILEDRVAFNVLDDLTTNPKWVITDTPGAIARKIFHDICVTGILGVEDIVPFIADVEILPSDTIPEDDAIITAELDPQSVYEVIEDICQKYNLGFRIIRNFDLSQLAFDIYAGSDRTSSQNELPVVTFSLDLDNLKNTTELKSVSGVKNMAYVFSNLGFEKVVAVGADPDAIGFERNILVVVMDGLDEEMSPEDATAAMQQKGLEELVAAREFYGFDGEVSQKSQYKYGVDYQLGDLVELHGKDGAANNMRVTEQIFVSDAEGERSYPTLTITQVVTPGSWLGQGTIEWFDYDDDLETYWESMP